MTSSSDRRQFMRTVGLGIAGMTPAFLSRAEAEGGQRRRARRVRGAQPHLPYLNPEAFGVVGDGATDDSEAFTKLLHLASSEGRTVFIRSGLTIRVQTNLFIYNHATILGESKHHSKIVLTAADEPDVSERWIHCGISKKGDSDRTWRGRIANVQFVLEAPTGEVINLHAAEAFSFENCIIDQRALGHFAGNCLKSGFSDWCQAIPMSRCTPRDGRIVNNSLMGAASGGVSGDGGAGINLSNAKRLWIAGNRIEGFRDDAIAVIGSEDCVVQGNWARGIESRMGSFSGKGNSFIGNYLERQPGRDGIWRSESTFYATHLQGAAGTPESIQFIGNTAVLPKDAPDAENRDGEQAQASMVLIGGVNGCLVHGNRLINESPHQTLRPRLWLIPLGLDSSLPGDQVSRPKNVEILGNIMGGRYPGVMEATDGSLTGPIFFQGNLASGYIIETPTAFRIAALNTEGEWMDSNLTV